MATYASAANIGISGNYNNTNIYQGGQRGVAMVLALITAVVLSPLYVKRKNESHYYEMKLSSGLVLPMLLAGLIVAIRTTSSCSSSTSSMQSGGGGAAASINIPSADPSWVLRIGGSSWGLAGILLMLMLVLSCQGSVQEFFWR